MRLKDDVNIAEGDEVIIYKREFGIEAVTSIYYVLSIASVQKTGKKCDSMYIYTCKE